VGTCFAILAKRAGAFIIGSAGTGEKVDYMLNQTGFDAAFNYRTKDARAELVAAAPGGLDVYFDLVSGETLDIALEQLKMNGQVLVVGNVSTTNAKTPYLTKNLGMIITKALKLEGFNGFQHIHRFPQMWKELGPLVASGEIKRQKETVIKNLENAPQVYVDYMNGKYVGKIIIDVAEI
ncbi:hypothetical protein EDD21DRAFT_308098, partial [Dissophora ornata]